MSDLLQKYNEYESARSELIADMRKLRNEISEYIVDNDLECEINCGAFDGKYDSSPNDDSFHISILGGNVFFHFSKPDPYDDYEYTWSFTYQPNWEGLSVEEIVQDIVKQSKELFDSQRKRAIDEVKFRAEELGISVSEGSK